MTKKKLIAGKSLTNKTSEEVNKKPAIEEDKFLIVGMGASAGGLEAFKEFFETMPKKPGMAFILVQHLDPTHKSLMVSLLKKYTDMTVSEVKDNTKVEVNHVYVIPPNKDMQIFNGTLHLMEPTKARGFRRPIDFFFSSLADDQMDRAVGIILSGTGTEGTLSLKHIKGHGGLSIVQDPKTAKYDGMPGSAIAAGSEDFILPVKDMPDLLVNYSKNRKFKPEEKPIKPTTPSELLEKVFILLRNETGCNFSDYKSNTVIRRIEKRMALNQINKLENYIKQLQKNPEEVKKLFKELLINVTSFFRDKEAFKALEEIGIPDIIKNKKNDDTIRIWVPGCATGEEAYSLAILFDEAVRKNSKTIKIQIFASDLDINAINFARQGFYPESISADISPERLLKYFQKDALTYQIKKEIRDMVIFAEHNLIKDPPFSKQDMISCRNLLIYLNPEAQKKVFAIFHYALNIHGLLFLGSSESLGDYANLFEIIDRKNKLFKHKNTKVKSLPDIGHLFKEPTVVKTIANSGHRLEGQLSLSGITEKLLLANYAPPCAIIDGKANALYFSGNTGKYLQPSPGEARLNILDMAREGLKTDLSSIISKVKKTKKPEFRPNVKVKTNGSIELIDLRIRPLNQLSLTDELLMVTFEDGKDFKKESLKENKRNIEDTSEVRALEQELAATKEYLRSTIEQLELSNEELKSSNEELQSSNEELQSTNEEMETSKEELQSVNEELITVNAELQSKIDELALSYDDMNNLLASTEIGTIFLDSTAKIKRFTPSMTKIINLIPSDVGRPLEDLSSNLIYDGILDDVQKVLTKLTPVKASVKSTDGIWYQMQIRPYRTLENVIKGVVITFVDITQEKLLTAQLNDYKQKYEYLLDITKTIVYTQDLNLSYKSIANINSEFQFKNMIGKKDKDFFNKEDSKKLETIKKKVLKTGKPSRQNITLKISNALKYYDLMVRPIYKNEKIDGIACAAIDISELIQAEQELNEYKEGENGSKKA